MSDEKRKVLEMVEAGKITPEDGERLLAALGEDRAEDLPGQPVNRQPESLRDKIDQDVQKAEQTAQVSDKTADDISETVEKTINEALESGETDWNAIGENINDAVTNQMNAAFGVGDVGSVTVNTENGETVTINLDKGASEGEVKNITVNTTDGNTVTLRMDGDPMAVAEQAAAEAERVAEDAERAIRQAEETQSQADREEAQRLQADADEARRKAEQARREAQAGTWPTPPAPLEGLAPLKTGGNAYPCAELPDARLEDVRINWVAGPVEVRYSQDNTLRVTEYANHPLKDDEHLVLDLEDGEMEIKWMNKRWGRRGFFVGVPPLSKHLVVELPRSAANLEELEVISVSGGIYIQDVASDGVSVNNVSGPIQACGIKGDDVNFSNVSGPIQLVGIAAEDLTVKGVSGPVCVQCAQADDVHISAVSGKLEALNISGEDVIVSTVSGSLTATVDRADDLTVNTTSGGVQVNLSVLPDDVTMKSVSGRLCLALPDDPHTGFTAHYTTMSGKFTSEFPLAGHMEKRAGEGAYGEGDAEIHFNTVSGGMELRRK